MYAPTQKIRDKAKDFTAVKFKAICGNHNANAH